MHHQRPSFLPAKPETTLEDLDVGAQALYRLQGTRQKPY